MYSRHSLAFSHVAPVLTGGALAVADSGCSQMASSNQGGHYGTNPANGHGGWGNGADGGAGGLPVDSGGARVAGASAAGCTGTTSVCAAMAPIPSLPIVSYGNEVGSGKASFTWTASGS